MSKATAKVEKLRKSFEEEGIYFKFYEFSDTTISVEDSVERLGIKPDRIVKSIVFKGDNNFFIVAIVSGNKRVDENKLSNACGVKVEIAKAREVEKFTGYKVGEVPPVGHGLKTYLDEDIMNYRKVIGGGGSVRTLVELKPRDIVEMTGAEVSEIA